MGFIMKAAVISVLLYGLAYFTGFVEGPTGGEVVTLRSFGEAGVGSDTSLWVVDIDRRQYLRSGRESSDWLTRLRANPDVQLTRNGQTGDYRAVVVPKMQDVVNRRMAEKYGFSETLVGWWIEPAETIPIRLDPIRR